MSWCLKILNTVFNITVLTHTWHYLINWIRNIDKECAQTISVYSLFDSWEKKRLPLRNWFIYSNFQFIYFVYVFATSTVWHWLTHCAHFIAFILYVYTMAIEAKSTPPKMIIVKSKILSKLDWHVFLFNSWIAQKYRHKSIISLFSTVQLQFRCFLHSVCAEKVGKP